MGEDIGDEIIDLVIRLGSLKVTMMKVDAEVVAVSLSSIIRPMAAFAQRSDSIVVSGHQRGRRRI